MLNLGTPESVTLASNAITVSQTYVQMFVPAGTATQRQLRTINGGQTGDVLLLRVTNDSANATVMDDVDNLKLSSDRTLSHQNDTLLLFCAGANWLEIAFANNT